MFKYSYHSTMERIYFSENGKLRCYAYERDSIIGGAEHQHSHADICSILGIENPVSITDNQYTEIGPRKTFTTAFSSNVINILKRIGVNCVSKFDLVKLYDINEPYTMDPLLETFYGTDNQISPYYPKTIALTDKETLGEYGLSFDKQEIAIYKNIYKTKDRDPTSTELFDLCQSNSEHSRHWFFKGKLMLSGRVLPDTLFDMVKSTLSQNSNSLVAFSDNSSVIKGFSVRDEHGNSEQTDLVLTAETHNFPTLICPFEGANTGVGGRIRDNHATGKGANLIASLAGYCVGDLETTITDYKSPRDILINASNGASDYGNKIGEPIIGGFTRAYGAGDTEWIKPIMFSAGIGSIRRANIKKDTPSVGDLIVRIGGPAYKIGLGGGFSSSLEQNKERKSLDISAVQRGDPQMGNKLNRVIRFLSAMKENPIISIHDQGAGGLANVVKEIVYPLGGAVALENVTCGDNGLHPLEIWCSEFQESDVLLTKKENLAIIRTMCRHENICCDVLGAVGDTGAIVVTYKNETIMDLPLEEILEPGIQKEYILDNGSLEPVCLEDTVILQEASIGYYLEKVLQSVDVGSKRFLTNKVDRSVTGLIAQQQCVGPFGTPISNYSLVSIGYRDHHGTASAIGEKPILGLCNSEAQGSMAVAEMITNIMGAYIGNIENIKCSANWMWPLKQPGEKGRLYATAKRMCKTIKILRIGIDGGKDSLSMAVETDKSMVKSPGTLVITGYAPCHDIRKRVTPEFKRVGSAVVLINFTHGKERLGGSALLRETGATITSEPCPKMNDNNLVYLKNGFNIIQHMIANDMVLALHDRSDGGVITALTEMAIGSNIGFSLYHPATISFLFNEEVGIILELDSDGVSFLSEENISYTVIGKTTEEPVIRVNDTLLPLSQLSEWWENTSMTLEADQTDEKCVRAEYGDYSKFIAPKYNLPAAVLDYCLTEPIWPKMKDAPIVAIIRDEGSNGDSEMVAAFQYAGFITVNINMRNLIANPSMLRNVRGIAYVGGFTHSDVLGAAQGWHISIKNNSNLQKELNIFMEREDTFSLGVCNGCQLMVKQSVFGPDVRLGLNDSGRFESRFSTVTVQPDTKCVFFKDMGGMSFGIWVAHGEGKFTNVGNLDEEMKALTYQVEEGAHNYPGNPNGSEENIAGLVSRDGRHLAMMPHPERCFLEWQVPHKGHYNNIKRSPWGLMFRNVYDWAINAN